MLHPPHKFGWFPATAATPTTDTKISPFLASSASAPIPHTSNAMAPNAAYVTLLTKTEYLAGTLVLFQSLCDVNAKHPLVVMVTPPVRKAVRTVLESRGIQLVEVESLLPKAGTHALAGHDVRFEDTWTKLR